MLEPHEVKNEKENPKIQVDRDVLSAMLKAWFTPRSTGNFVQTKDEREKKEDTPSIGKN